MGVTITFDPHHAVEVLDAYGERQLPFAAALALNRSAQEVQARLQQEVHAKLAIRTARSATFMERLVKIDPRRDRATKANLQAGVRIEGPEGDEGRAEILTRHIAGGTHTLPGTPLQAFFIPADASRPTRMSIVPRVLYPKNLRLMDRHDVVGTLPAHAHVTGSGKVQFKGKRRTFIKTDPSGRAFGIYQREGKGKDDIQMLWFYTPHITIPKRYDFYGIARATFLERFPINMRGMLAYALATAR